jgi:predicted N-acetyltransferase YhbS
VAVDAAYRKCGIGKHIVSFLIDTLRQSGISWIGLISQNHTYSFYRKLGFNPMKAVAMILP